MAMYAKVRRMGLRDGLSISEIARRTSLSRSTIKGCLRGPLRSEMTYRRSLNTKTIGPFETALRQALEANARRPRRERRTACKLHAQLRVDGFAGSYARVTEFVRAWRADQGAVCSVIPLLRHRSATFRPASPSRTIFRIWPSVNLLRFIGPPVFGGPSFYAGRIRGAGQSQNATLGPALPHPK
jgi:hypothetical protein